MHTSLKLSAFLLCAFLAIAVNVRAANNCKASTVFGAGCSTDCEGGWHGECSGGVFSADCKCVKDGQTGYHSRNLPILTPQLQIDCQQFEDWTRNNTSPALQQLSPLVTNSRLTAQSGNVLAYNQAEDQFSQAYNNLSLPDQQSISLWRTQHGYFN